MKNVLTIAGSDPSGGAGIQADLKTMCAHGVYGMSVITAITVQNTCKVFDTQDISPEIVAAQIDAVFNDIPVHAVKIGMVSDVRIIRAIRERLLFHDAKNIVVDPVMVSKSGYRLLRQEAELTMRELIAVADLITPNIPEAELLAGKIINTQADMEDTAHTLIENGAKAVLIKGGHLKDNANDLLLTANGITWLTSTRIPTKNTHGTGCTLSSAIVCGLAGGKELEQAVLTAKEYITQAIRDSLSIGKGVGPLGHMHQLYRKAGMLLEGEDSRE